MVKLITTILIALLFPYLASGQIFDQIKLTEKELPEGYAFSKSILCKSSLVCSLYSISDWYRNDKLKFKNIQSFRSKTEEGCILYYEFEKKFTNLNEFEQILWYPNNKPTKANEEEYLIKSNILIIWSLSKNSEITKISKKKIGKFLK